jgi:hypothetical protein
VAKWAIDHEFKITLQDVDDSDAEPGCAGEESAKQANPTAPSLTMRSAIEHRVLPIILDPRKMYGLPSGSLEPMYSLSPLAFLAMCS